MKKIFTLVAGIALAGSLSANAEKVYLTPSDYNFNALADYSESEISLGEDGSIVLSDFMYSEAPLSFKFEIPAVNESSNMIFTGNLDREDVYPYFLTPDGNYMTCWMWNYKDSNDWTPIYYPYAFEDGYSWVSRYDTSDPQNTSEFFGRISMAGYNADNSFFGYVYIDFFFNMPDPSAVNSIEAAADARVEYFNLAGQRVAEPKGGLFIKKQGANASKVMIK